MRHQRTVFVLFLTVGISAALQTSRAQVYETYSDGYVNEYEVPNSAVITDPAAYSGEYVVVEAEEVEWVRDYESARKLAEQKRLPVLLFVTSDSCHYCEMMRRDVFTDSRIVNVLKQSYVAAKLTIAPNSKLADELKITLFPTTVIIDSDGNVLDYARGYRKSTDIHERIVAAVSSVARVARK